MKTILISIILILSSISFAAEKTYQVTGPILEMNENSIIVQKGKEKWEIKKDTAAKITGDLKVGSKVTVEYTMTTKNIEVKEDKKKK